MGRGRGGARLLLAEDDAELAGMLVELFAGEGYAVDAVYDGQSALHRALNRAYEVAVFDRGLSHVEGLELLSRLRRAGWSTPVLVLSAYGAARDRVAGRTVELSARESALLGVLAGRPGRVFPREELLDRVFPPLRSRTWSYLRVLSAPQAGSRRHPYRARCRISARPDAAARPGAGVSWC